jgi:hypothetical protein
MHPKPEPGPERVHTWLRRGSLLLRLGRGLRRRSLAFLLRAGVAAGAVRVGRGSADDGLKRPGST